MDSSYLELDTLKRRLVSSGTYSLSNLPPDEDLEFIVEIAEARLEAWLGRRIGPTNYLDRYKTDIYGVCLLRHFPVLDVNKITMVPIERFGYAASPLTLGPFLGNWWQGRKISTGRPQVTVEISYVAGVDPIPRIITHTFYQLVYSILKNSGTTGDLSFLDTPTRDVASISLPGGITKSYKIPDAKVLAGGGTAIGTSQLDRLLTPLAGHRLVYLT